MHAQTTPRVPPRALMGLLALAGAAIVGLALATNARASSALLASATKQGSDGHPYHWAAPC